MSVRPSVRPASRTGRLPQLSALELRAGMAFPASSGSSAPRPEAVIAPVSYPARLST